MDHFYCSEEEDMDAICTLSFKHNAQLLLYKHELSPVDCTRLYFL